MALVRRILLLCVFACSMNAARAVESTIYVNPAGNDANSGTSTGGAVATIGRAVRLAEHTPPGAERINILLSGGRYLAQHFETSGNVDGTPIVITSAPGGMAVFDGNGGGGTWMTVNPRNDRPSNLRIERITVTDYETVIDARGNRNSPHRWAGGMVIHGNRFTSIGDIASSRAEPSTAAIRLVNSSGNSIIRNVFEHIRNRQVCDVLHAIYVAHHSTGNVIENNYFDDACGDSIRFRDASDRNIVRLNTFKDAWHRNPISDWFCDRDKRSDCTKAAGECPSFDNLIESNKVISRSEAPVEVFIPWGDVPARCGTGQRAILR